MSTKNLVGTEMATQEYQRPQVSQAILNSSNETLSEDDLFNKAFSFHGKNEATKAQAALDAFVERFPESGKLAKVKLQHAYWTFEVSPDQEAINEFESIKRDYPDKKEAGEASLRLGYIRLRNNDPDSAMAEFESVAKGNVTASDEVRLESMFRCAKIYHARKDRVKALQAWRECADVTDRASFDHDVHLEIAGLYMELARSGAGSLDDCIAECDEVISHPAGSDRCYATALQMKAESFHLKNDFQTAIAIEKELLEKYPDQKQMAMLARFFMGLSYYKLEDPWNSLKSMENVQNEFTDSNNLPGNDLRFSSRLYQAQALLKMEKRPEAKAILKEIINEKPYSKEASNAQKLLDVLQ